MTLIVAALTRDYVVIGSDRRITSREYTADGWKIRSQEDSDVKTILLNGQYALGFCGRGRVGDERERIESWAARTLRGVDPSLYFEKLAESATELWRHNSYRDAHAFLAVGFRIDPVNSVRHAEAVLIANSLDERGEFDPRRPSDADFKIAIHPLRGKNDVRTVGWPIDSDRFRQFRKTVRRSGNELTPNSQDVFEPMAQLMGDTAEISNGFVGDAFMITSIPRGAVPLEPGLSMELSMPVRDSYLRREISLTVRNAASGTTDRSLFFPSHVGPMVTIMGATANLDGEVIERVDLKPDSGYNWTDEVQ